MLSVVIDFHSRLDEEQPSMFSIFTDQRSAVVVPRRAMAAMRKVCVSVCVPAKTSELNDL